MLATMMPIELYGAPGDMDVTVTYPSCWAVWSGRIGVKGVCLWMGEGGVVKRVWTAETCAVWRGEEVVIYGVVFCV